MFHSDINNARVKRIKNFFDDPLSEISLLFLKSFLPLLTGPNRQLQREAPQAPYVYSIMTSLLSKIICRYASDEDPDFDDLENLDFLDGKSISFCQCQHVHKIVIGTEYHKYLFGGGLTTSNLVRKREMRTIHCDNTCGEYATVHCETSIHKYTTYKKHGNLIGPVAVMCMCVIVDVIRMQMTI